MTPELRSHRRANPTHDPLVDVVVPFYMNGEKLLTPTKRSGHSSAMRASATPSPPTKYQVKHNSWLLVLNGIGTTTKEGEVLQP